MMARIWHSVQIEPDCKDQSGLPALSRALSDEIEAWIIEHVVTDEGYNGFWANPSFLLYKFTSVEVAMAFKLRWL